MNVQANAQVAARASAAIHCAQSIPVLRASAFCGGDAQTRTLVLHASKPEWAQTIVTELEAQARYWRLDSTLYQTLKIAKATVTRSRTARPTLQ